MVMVKEYYDKLAGSPHLLTLFPSSFAGAMGSAGAAACATCHDPHSSNYVAQLRYPISSTNYSHVVPLLFTTTAVVTNYGWSYITNYPVTTNTTIITNAGPPISYTTNKSNVTNVRDWIHPIHHQHAHQQHRV